MKRHFENLIDRATRAIKHWGLLLLAGILCVALGVAVFVFPLESYVTLSILFGVFLLVSGAAQLIIALSSGNYLMMRGYIIAGGVIDLLLGIFLCAFPAVSLVVLPIMMGICMLYHSFMTIAFGGDMETFRLSGSTWVICGGVILLILSLLVLANPLSVGIETVVVICGLGLLMLGVLLSAISMKLKDIHTSLEKEYPRQ